MRKLSFCLLLMLYVALPSAYADILLGNVIGVSDGDTITVLDKAKTQHKIRLVGIDAPEKKQPFGQASKHSLSDMVFGKDVRVEWTKKDRYQRTLGKVLVEGKDVCLEQVKRGMAWHYKKYQSDQTLEDQKLYSDAEVQARTSKFGLWAESNPIEPSVFRHKK
jgi:endonuclease YncB( thermonuclease family)